MKSQFFLSCLALFIFAGVALGEGAYQRTQDDKTIVWNNAPKEGDTAKWNGDRDADGYATGFGTLTWYTTDTEIFASYYGNMVRGKLDGPVNVHSRGKTAHSIFVGGKRSTRWTMGRSPSSYAIAKRLAAVRERVAKAEEGENAQHSTPNAQPASAVDGLRRGERPIEEQTAESTGAEKGSAEEENPPSRGYGVASAQPASAVDGLRRGEHPMEEAAVGSSAPTKSEVAPETIAKVQKENPPKDGSEPDGHVASNSESVREQAVQPASAVDGLRRGERPTTEAVPELLMSRGDSPAEGPAVAKEEKENPQPASAADGLRRGESPTANRSPVPKDSGLARAQRQNPKSSSGGLVGYKEAKDKKPAAAKLSQKSSGSGTAASPPPEEKKPAVDDSVRLVMQPPSSLRQPSEEAAGSDGQAQLTKEEVIGAADTAARAAGYDLKEYERPRAEYNSAAGTWSLVYDRRPIGGNAETGEPFSVAVDDKTKKASIVAGL